MNKTQLTDDQVADIAIKYRDKIVSADHKVGNAFIIADAIREAVGIAATNAAPSTAHDADFETWARAEFGCGFDGDDYLFVRGDDGFEDDRTAGAWAAWQHLTAAAKSTAPVDDEYCTLCAFPKGHSGCKCEPSAAHSQGNAGGNPHFPPESASQTPSAAPAAVFEGYVDNMPVIAFSDGQSVPAGTPLYAAPVDAQTVALSMEQIIEIDDKHRCINPESGCELFDTLGFARSIEAAVKAQIAAAPAAPSVPAGFKLVPIKPTEAMILAANHEDEYLSDVFDIYRAMLAAAPEAPQHSHDELQVTSADLEAIRRFKLEQEGEAPEAPQQDAVTLESALQAIEHVEMYNGLGRAAEARAMLRRIQ